MENMDDNNCSDRKATTPCQPDPRTLAILRGDEGNVDMNALRHLDSQRRVEELRQALPPILPASGERLRTPPPTTAPGTTLKFNIGVEHGYLTVCERDDGIPCAIFVCLAKHGDELRGALDAWARCFSVALQYGVPLSDLCGKFKHQRFEPNGWTDVEGIGFATSIPDFVVRWLERRYLAGEAA